MEMHKYRLSHHCRLVKGASASAIYDLFNNQVFSLNKDATYILEHAFSDDLVFDDATQSFIDDLCSRRLLNYNDYPDINQTTNTKAKLRYVWLEITNRCNCRCLHCYGAFGAPTNEKIKNELSYEAWIRILDSIYEYGCNSIQLIGGEPLLHPRFRDLLYYAHNKGFETIDVFTNGTLINPSIIDILKKTGASVRVSLYGYDQLSHEQVTQVPGSFTRLDHALDLLRIAKIPTRIAVVLMKENQAYLDQIISYINSKGHSYTGFDTVRKVRHSIQFSHEVTDKSIKMVRVLNRPSFCTSCVDFYNNSQWNSCWYGKFAITAMGDIIPCIFARDKICGNLQYDSLKEIKEKLQFYWSINKDKILVCCDCEYRYACDDCRPLAEGETGSLYAKYPRCLYDPYTATWND